MDKYDVMLSWVSVQNNVEGKENADKLARQCSSMDICNADMSPLVNQKKLIQNKVKREYTSILECKGPRVI